jgi:hypothetical protein
MSDPQGPSAYNPYFNPSGNAPDNPPENTTPSGYISRDELDRILAERDQKHAEEMATVKSRLPVAIVPANGGGPGNDNHQVSWSLAEQETAARGDVLDHWVIQG